jgi:hypothetical protein
MCSEILVVTSVSVGEGNWPKAAAVTRNIMTGGIAAGYRIVRRIS